MSYLIPTKILKYQVIDKKIRKNYNNQICIKYNPTRKTNKIQMDEQFPQVFMSSESDRGRQTQTQIGIRSIVMKQNQVEFVKHGVIVDKFGIKGQDNIQINPDLIKEEKKIGRGSAGQVWLATYYKDNQELQVAIKEIAVDQKESRDQFIQDLRAFIDSDSPYIVKFYGCFYKEGYLSQVMEYMNMGSIRDIINFNKKTIPPRPLIQQILAEFSFCILSGLWYIHKNKHQIHRDIKPENILINNAGEVKITDFGISKQLEKTLGFSSTWVGTHIYMSPQRIQARQYNSNCDVWSFGLVLYELATNRQLPYRKGQNESQFHLIKKIRQLPSPAFEPTDDRSPEFQNFLSRCLQKNYHQRASVQELLKHPWIIKHSDNSMIKEYLKCLNKKMNKVTKNK